MCILLCVLFSLIATASGSSSYFTMVNIELTIPLDKKSTLQGNHSLITLYSQSTSKNKIYSLQDKENFLAISPTLGQIFFTNNFIKMKKRSTEISSTILLHNNDLSQENETSFKIDVRSMESVDCEFFIQELCFWKSVEYQIDENTKPSIIGSMSSPYFNKICPQHKRKYKILTKLKEFEINFIDGSWILQSSRELDREVKSKYSIDILCTVENMEKTEKNITKTLQISVLDRDDNPPHPQINLIHVSFQSKSVRKDQMVEHEEFIFHDKDSSIVNNYQVEILGDKEQILKSEYVKHENDNKEPSQTAIYCKLKFVKNFRMVHWTYNVTLQLNDTTLDKGEKLVHLPISLDFHDETNGFHPRSIRDQLSTPHLYPSNKVKIFRTAAPLARVIQPKHDKIMNGTQFTLHTHNPNEKNIFKITPLTGIVFVHDFEKLRSASEYLRLKISWNTTEFDEIEVHITDEPTKTCFNVTSLDKWRSCSRYKSPEKCTRATSCGIATGGAASVSKREGPQRCMWRGDRTPSMEITTLYATCTPDVDTCPDGLCDELEELHHLVCPQDCTTNVLFPAGKAESGRGIHRGSGVCTCDDITCHCTPMNFNSKQKVNKTIIQKNQTMPDQFDAVKHTGIGKVFQCGTTCILSIVAASVFLLGIVTVVAICWRLERKSNSEKFYNENQDLSVPFSDYVDRSMPSQPLPLHFNMTTSLVDPSLANILNKYMIEPKWEFPRNQLSIEQILGEGEFGKVLRAKAINIAGQSGETTVAVKTLKDDARESEFNDLLSEYQLLKEISHPNIIRLLGICTGPGGPVYLIIEFAEYGSLRNYLRRSRHLQSDSTKFLANTAEMDYDEPSVQIPKVTYNEILSFAWQISKGMAYLTEIKLVHRDLAARNVLLAADKICKISDFGLTRDIYEDDAYFKQSKGRVPVKWMAPESLADHVYTNKSDIWSFGVLIWELVTLGATPYPGIAVQNLFHLLKRGYRMERPDNCSTSLYNIMRNCWHIDPEQRPSFQQLSVQLEKMLSSAIEYLDLAGNAIINKSYFCEHFNEDVDDDEDSSPHQSNSNNLNYLSRSQSYIKCGSADKMHENMGFLLEKPREAQGYETPVKLNKKPTTPSNECNEYYADMATKLETVHD